MFLNKIIVARRKEMKISQIKLAAGICTQATISKLESQGLAPSPDILVRICKRLNLTLNDVFSDFNDEVKEALQNKIDQVFQLTSSYHFEKAAKLLDSIKENQARDKGLLNVLYYLKGNLALNWKKDFDEAQFFFNWILEHTANDQISYEQLFALKGLGIIYFEKNKSDLAAYYFDQINQVIVEDKKFPDNQRSVHLLANLANFYASNKQFKKSLKASQAGLDIIKETKVFSYLEQLLYARAYALTQTEADSEQVKSLLQQAQAFARFSGNQSVVDYVDHYFQTGEFKAADRQEDAVADTESFPLPSGN
ncbi:helix-turn-helix domain-containing protein [Oenococcus sp.]|uniref:helix-turn-helix domain-containing protein n=1 Tax=Oenococcus sp. TaxID=1979414 RepID=UPI0039E84764